jgi:flagellar biosynthesis protein FlhF
MRLKLFHAPTVAAAMTQVRAELGADALILSSRRAGGGVEVTAALEDEAPTLPDAARLEALRWHGAPPALAAALAAGPLDQALATHLRFEALDFSPGAAPLLLAGPPGAGKTLTTARLAARLVLGGQSPLVICTDGARAGAAEQLAAFTRVLGLVLIVAPDALTMARALARREAGCPVLIDTAGIDPFSLADHTELAGLAGAAAARCLVVLPAGLDPAEAADAAAAFAAAGATLMAPTRLDIARRLGGVLAAAAAGLALTEAGVGPGAADGLHPLTPAWLAGRLAPPPTRKAA